MAFDPNTDLRASGIQLVDYEDNSRQTVTGTVSIYICPKCDGTHFEIHIPGGALKMVMPPEIAEKLAQRMTNPAPVNPNEQTFFPKK